MYHDSHAHLTSSSIYEDVDAVLARAKTACLQKIINVATDEKSLLAGLELSKRYPWVQNAAAVHPHDAEKEGDVFFPVVKVYATKGAIIAVGETGLDYHYDHSKREIQQDQFRKHLRLALECKLPVIIHCRNAFEDFFRILDEEYVVSGKHAPGVLHCFTGTLEEAKEVLKRGWYISFSGIITFKKSEELRNVVRIVPLDRILVETDAPYLAPQSKRGHPNEPAYVVETTQVLASIKEVSVEALSKAAYTNMCSLFKI